VSRGARGGAPKRKGAHRLGYDAAKGGTRRQTRPIETRSEDKVLPRHRRRQVVSTARDAVRNFAVVQWALGKHLDYVTSFNFQSRSGMPELDARIEELMAWWSRPLNFDVARRHGLRRMLRILEIRRTLDGDVFLLKLRGGADRGRVQGLEGDRVAEPTGGEQYGGAGRSLHGVIVDDALRATAYTVCKRGESGGLTLERRIPASSILHHGYWQRLDQVRGVSPLLPALNTLADMYAGFDLALAKMELSQLYGIALFRESFGSVGNVTGNDENGAADAGFVVDLGNGPVQLDLATGDRAEFLESKSPPLEFQSWSQAMMMLVLKALDIPYSFYDEKHTNYSGQRQAWLQYDRSSEAKREDNRWLLDALTTWRLGLFVDDGVLELPRGMAIRDLRWEWINRGIPWMQPLQEIQADERGLQNFLTSRSRIYKRAYGGDWETEVAEELAREKDILTKLGLWGK
jgi:capsid protein